MKVLKSGVEMTPEDLKRLTGGACACGCDYSSEVVHAHGVYGGVCVCNCKHGQVFNSGGSTTASSYI